MKRFSPVAALRYANSLEAQGKREAALELYQEVVDSGHPDAAPKAGYILGHLRKRMQDLPRAVAALQQVVDSDSPEWAPEAAYSLAGVLEEMGSYDEAAAVYQKLVDSGHTVAALALGNFAELRMKQGRFDEAAGYLNRAIGIGNQHVAARGLAMLGRVRQLQGDTAAAVRLFQMAANTGDPDVVSFARRGLRQLGDDG
jgi:tetratricopeptide (TPR) repeat protein